MQSRILVKNNLDLWITFVFNLLNSIRKSVTYCFKTNMEFVFVHSFLYLLLPKINIIPKQFFLNKNPSEIELIFL